MGLGDFVYVLSRLPISDFPYISSKLPPMESDEICKQWTGSTGPVVMEQAIDFVRSCSSTFASITGKPLTGKRILDFGCGYGRFLRSFRFYTHEVYGVDAWEISLDHCRRSGLGDYVFKSDAVPDILPAPGKFDLLTAFSVFTHLSETAAVRSLEALRKSAKRGAVLVITIRPFEFWEFAAEGSLSSRKAEAMACAEHHAREGFAFLPHASGQVEHYGDTSFTISWLETAAQGWDIVCLDRSVRDPLQRYVFLKAR